MLCDARCEPASVKSSPCQLNDVAAVAGVDWRGEREKEREGLGVVLALEMRSGTAAAVAWRRRTMPKGGTQSPKVLSYWYLFHYQFIF